MFSSDQMQPRNGVKFVAVLGARISGCPSQKEVSLEDQIEHGKDIVLELYDGEVEYIIIQTKGKGKRLDRPELLELEKILLTKAVDLVVYEDISRLIRGADAVRLCGIAVDHGTPVVAPNDCIDTNEPTWEEDVLSACRDHVGHNAHTSKRLKQKLMNRFRKFGGAQADFPYGYIMPPGGKTYFDAQLDPDATAHILKGVTILRQTLNFSETARYFQKAGVPVGPACRLREWDGVMVRRLYTNTILKGMPRRGSKMTKKHHQTGRRISVNNPGGPNYI